MLGKNCTSSRFSKELTVINNLRDCEPKLISKSFDFKRAETVNERAEPPFVLGTAVSSAVFHSSLPQ